MREGQPEVRPASEETSEDADSRSGRGSSGITMKEILFYVIFTLLMIVIAVVVVKVIFKPDNTPQQQQKFASAPAPDNAVPSDWIPQLSDKPVFAFEPFQINTADVYSGKILNVLIHVVLQDKEVKSKLEKLPLYKLQLRDRCIEILGFFKTARFGVEDTLTLFSRQTPPIGGKSAEKSCDSVAFATADTCGLNPPSRWFPSQSPTAQRGSAPVVCHGQRVRYCVLSPTTTGIPDSLVF